MTASYSTILDCLASSDRRKRRRGRRLRARRREAVAAWIYADLMRACSDMAGGMDSLTVTVERVRGQIVRAFAIPAERLKEPPFRVHNHYGAVVHDATMGRNELIRRSIS